MSREPFQISDEVQKLLEQAGWSPDRRIDTSGCEQVLTGMEYLLHSVPSH